MPVGSRDLLSSNGLVQRGDGGSHHSPHQCPCKRCSDLETYLLSMKRSWFGVGWQLGPSAQQWLCLMKIWWVSSFSSSSGPGFAHSQSRSTTRNHQQKQISYWSSATKHQCKFLCRSLNIAAIYKSLPM